MRNFFWSDENEKMLKTAKAWKDRFGRRARFVSFNLPRLQSDSGQRTCPYAGTCADICYAGQGRMGMPAATSTRERNLNKINQLTMPKVRDALIVDINRMLSTTHIRIHDSGDFFSRPYYRAWVEVAEACPEMIFYAYTKSIPFLD